MLVELIVVMIVPGKLTGAFSAKLNNDRNQFLFEHIAADRPIRIFAARVDNDLTLAAQAQYWSGQSSVLNNDDTGTGTILSAAGGANAVALSVYVGPVVASLSAANLGASHVSGFTANGAGKWNPIPAKPSPVATGSVSVAINLGPGTADQSCLSRRPPAITGLALPWLRAQNGSLYPDGTACPTSYDRDSSARAMFGIYAPETQGDHPCA